MQKPGSVEHVSDIANTEWIENQKRTFRRWANSRLSVYNMEISDLNTDLKSGVKLLNLICALTGRAIPRHNKITNTKYACLENLNQIFTILKEENIKMVNIGSQDIYDGNIKLILGLMWTLILNYQVGAALKDSNIKKDNNLSQKESLAQFILERLKLREFRGKPKINFSSDWNDGVLLSGLVNSSAPNTIPDWLDLDPNESIENINKALEVAYEYLKIPSLILPEELISKDLDEKSVMTLASSVLVAKPVKPLPNLLKKCIPTKTTLKLDCCPTRMKKGIAVNSDFSFLVRGSCLTNDHTPPTVVFTNTDTGSVETPIIESIVNNVHEITIHPTVCGNYRLEVKSGEESIKMPLCVTLSDNNRVYVHELGKLEANRPCKVEIDSRYSGLDITSLGISGPSECQLLYPSNEGRKGSAIFLCQKPGKYLITFTTDADRKKIVSVPVNVLESKILEYITIGKDLIDKFENTVNCRPFLTFYDGKFEKNPLYITNMELENMTVTKYGAQEKIPIKFNLQTENLALATFHCQGKSLYMIESKIKTNSGRLISLTPKALKPQNDIQIYVNVPQQLAVILDSSKKADAILTDSSGASIAPLKKPEMIKINNKDAILYTFLANSPGLCKLEVSTANNKFEYQVMAVPSLNSIELLGLADLIENTHVNVPTKIYINLAKAYPSLVSEPNYIADNLRVEIESVKTGKKIAFKSESLGYGLVQIPMIFKNEGEYKLNIFVDDILLPQSVINFKVDSKKETKTITKFYKDPSKIKTHKIVKIFISLPYLPGKDFTVSIKGPITPQFKAKLLRYDCVVVALYTEEPGMYNIHMMCKDLPKGEADVSVEILPNPEKRVILGRDLIINSPQKLKTKLKFEAFGTKSAQRQFIIPKNAVLICTMVDASGAETILTNYKITKLGSLTNYINPSTSGIHTLNVKIQNDLKKFELHPIFFYVNDTPHFNNANENSVLINAKHHPLTGLCLLHSQSQIKLPFKNSIDREIDHLKVTENFFNLKDYGIYHIKASYKTGKKVKYLDYPINSIDTTEFKHILSNVSVVNNSIIISQGIPENEEYCFYLDASKVEYLENGIVYNMSDFATKGDIKSQLLQCHQANNIPIDLKVESCGSGYYKVIVPPLSKGMYSFSASYASYPLKESKMIFNVKPLAEVMTIKQIEGSSLAAEEIIPFYLNIGALEARKINVVIYGTAQADIAVGAIDNYNTFLYVYPHSAGFYKIELKDKNGEVIIKPLEFEISESNKLIKEKDFVFGVRPKAFFPYEKKSLITVLANSPSMLHTLPGLDDKSLKSKLNVAALDAKNISPLVCYDSKKSEATFKLISPANGLHLINISNDNSSLPFVPIPIYIDAIPQIYGCKEETFYYFNNDSSNNSVISYYPIGKKELEISIPVESATFAEKSCVRFQILPQSVGNHILRVIEGSKETLYQFNVQDPSKDKTIKPGEVTVAGKEDLQINGILPGVSYPLIVDFDKYENRLLDGVEHEVHGVCENLNENVPPINLIGIPLGDGMYQINVEVPKSSDYKLDFYYANQKISEEPIRFTAKPDAKSSLKVILKDDEKFFAHNPCRFIIDGRSSKSKVKSVTMKDGSPLSYIITKTFPKVYVCNFLSESAGPKVLLIESTDNDVIEYNCDLKPRDSSLPELPLPLGMAPVIGTKWKFNEKSQRIFIDRNSVKVLDQRIKLKNTFFAKLYSANSKESTKTEAILTKSKSFKGYITPSSTGLHVLVIGKKKSKTEYWNYYPIPFISNQVLTGSCGIPMTIDVAFANIKEVDFVYRNKVAKKIPTTDLKDYFNVKRTKIEFVPESSGEYAIRIYNAKKNFIEFPLKIHSKSLIQELLNKIRVLGVDYLDKYEIEVGSKRIIMIDATAIEYESDGTLSIIKDESGFKSVSGYLKDKSENKTPIFFTEISDGIYSSEILFDKEADLELSLFYAWNPILSAPKQMMIRNLPTPTINIVYSSSKEFLSCEPFYLIVYCSKKKNIRAFIKEEKVANSTIVIVPMMNNYQCVGVLINKPGDHTICIEYNDNTSVRDEYLLAVKENLSLESKNIYDFGALPRVNSLHRMITQPKIFMSPELPEVILPIPENSTVACQLMDSHSLINPIENSTNKGKKGIKYYVVPKNEGINAISLGCSLNSISITFLPTFFTASPEPVIFQSIPARFMIKQKLLLTDKMSVFYQNSKKKPEYSLRTPSSFLKENIKGYKVYVKCANVGNFVLNVPKLTGKTRFFAFKVETSTYPQRHANILTFTSDQKVAVKQAEYLTFDCTGLSQSEIANSELILEKLSDDQTIISETNINNPIISNGYASFQIPIEFSNGFYDATVISNNVELSLEPFSIKIDDTIKYHIELLIPKDHVYIEQHPVELLIYTPSSDKSKISFDISGPMNCLCWNQKVLPNISYCSFLPMDNGIYTISVLVDGAKQPDQDKNITVAAMSKGMARRPLPILYAPYSNNTFTMTIIPCVFSSLAEHKFKKNIEICPNDKIECQLVDVNSGNIVLVKILKQSLSEFKISFTSPYHGLHQLTGKVIKPDGAAIELLPIPIVVEDNTHKIGVENKFAISAKGQPQSCNMNITSGSKIPLSLSKKIKEKKYNDLYSLKGYYVPAFPGSVEILCNIPEQQSIMPIQFMNESLKPEDLVATQDQLFVKILPIPSGMDTSSNHLKLELKDPSNKTSKIKYDVDNSKENLIVSFKPKRSGIYNLKAKYNGITLGQSPYQIYSKVKSAVLSDSKSLIDVKIKTETPDAVKFILVKPDGTEENIIGYSICDSSKDGKEHSLALVCNFPEPGVYLIKSTIDSIPINVDPSFVVAEKKSKQICKIDELNEIRVPKKLLINHASGEIKVKAKIIDKCTIIPKAPMIINILPIENNENDVIVQVEAQASGLYTINPKKENHKPIFCEPISFYIEPMQYKVVDISAVNNSLSGPNKDIFFTLEDFPIFKSAAQCEIEGMVVEMSNKHNTVAKTNIIKSNKNKLGFIVADTLAPGKYTMSLMNKGKNILGSPIKLNAIVPDSLGNISSLAVSKNIELTPLLYKNDSSMPLTMEKSADNKLVICGTVNEYGAYHLNLSDTNARHIKEKYIMVVPPTTITVDQPLILKRPAMVDAMSNITVIVKNPLGMEIEASLKLLANDLILINAKLNIQGTYKITMYDDDGKIITPESIDFTYSIEKASTCKCEEPVKVNENIILYFPMLHTLRNKSDYDIMNIGSLVNRIGPNNAEFTAKIVHIDREKNLIAVSVTPTVSGLHYVSLIDSTSVVHSISQASSIIAYSKYNIDANKVTAHGEGLISSILNQESSFVVDMSNVPKKNLVVNSDFESVVFKMEACSDSKLNYTYVPNVMGDMIISVLYEGEHIIGSPFMVNVSDSKLFNLDSPIFFVPMKTMYFYIKKNLQDQTKNITVEVTDPKKKLVVSSHEVCKPAHGMVGSKICVKFYPSIHGIHVARFINKKHNKTIKDGIRNFYIGPWGYVPKDQFMLIGKGLTSAIVGKDNHFMILSKGDSKYSSFLVNVYGPTKCEFNMKCVEKDRVIVTYNPVEEGEYELEVKYEDENINGTPVKVKAVKPIKYSPFKEDVNSIYVQGEGIKKGAVDTLNLFSIFYNVAKSQEIKVKITNSNKEVDFNRSDMKGKIQNVTNIGYSPSEAGIYDIAILSGNNHINGSPFKVFVEKMNSHPALIKAFGIENISGKILSPSEFMIDATEGEDGVLDVQIRSQNNRIVVQPTIVRLEGQIYLVKLKFDTPTDYLISITWDGINIPSSPFKV